MNRSTKSRTKAIGYSCCYASEGSALCDGATVGKERGQGNTWVGFYCYSWIGLNDVKCKEQCAKCKKGAELREGLPY